jgi:DNA-damage-inducible protein J
MAKTATISLKLPEETKALFEADCSSIGLTPSALLQCIIKYITTRGKIPAEVLEPDPFYSAENQAWLKKSQEDLDAGRVVRKSFDELESMLEESIRSRP